jgi:4-hydroxy-tetrahydrodipicolinate synthase
VLGGAGGNYLPEELEAGAVGTMPHPAIIDAFRAVCDRYASRDAAGGDEIYLRQVAPLLRAVAVAGPGQGDGGGTMVWVHKALLVRAGVLRTSYCRAGNTPAPESVMARVWQHVERAGLLVARHATRGRPH